jgi:inner membrane protein
MDPLTQASVGAAVAAMLARRSETRWAVLLGALAGAAPDLDVLIQSESDPLLALEFHRHFTHSLFIAPFIGLLVAGLCKGLFYWKHWPYARMALFSVTGALTHGLIDASTSYGTLLYWPISGYRESWDIISIIDPIFTIPLVVLTTIAFVFRRPQTARSAIALCLVYLAFGAYQRTQATECAEALADARGHIPEELTVRPSFANTLLWRIVYRSGDRYFVDAVRTSPFAEPVYYPGKDVEAFGSDKAQSQLPAGTVLAEDVERFRFFSQGYLYRSPEAADLIGDLRYAMHPDSIEPLWGIRLNMDAPDSNVAFVHFRDPSKRAFARLWRMISAEPVGIID